MNRIFGVIKLFIKIFAILLILGLFFPYLFDSILKLFTFNGITDIPKENSTFVMSYRIFKNSFSYYIDKILGIYLNI